MKKIISIISLLYCFAAIFVTSVKAFEFEKFSNNPLTITYIQDYVYNFQAHIYKEGNLYKGIVPAKKINQDYFSLVAIESTDKVNWKMTKEIFVNQGKNISNPRLVVDKEDNKKIYFSQTDGIDLYRIYSIDCDNDLNCSSVANLVLGPDVNNPTENHGFFFFFLLNQDKYWLFYGVWGQNGFKIRLAYSDTLSNWQKCPGDVISYGPDGPFPYVENNDLYLFYHESDGSGIKLGKTSLPLNCGSVFTDLFYQIWPNASYDQKHIVYPSIISEDGELILYYTALGSNNAWTLNMACTGQACLSPTSTPTPTPTPIPVKTPIIIIPGLLASWNKEAIIHNINQPQSNWQLNPIVNEYKGIIGTLRNLNYQENQDFFVFNYDWRKPILNVTDDLNNFINEKIGDKKFFIIGHSLGGLIGRIYRQKYSNTNIEKLVTVGSPHYGAAQTYNVVEAGEIERSNDYLWLAVKMISALNKDSLETDKQTINRLFPVLKDLFPVYNFLRKNENEINISDMKTKNTLLPYYNSNLNNLTNLITIVGEKGNTLKGFNISSQTFFDKLLDNYPDGRPQSSYKEIGDYLVLSASASLNNPNVLNLDHNEIIYRKEAIKKILDLLNIQYEDSQVVEGRGTVIDSSLIFLIKSPAQMEVVANGQTYSEQDGMIFIEDAGSGDYQLKVKGTGNGSYEVIIGQIGRNDDVWGNIYGETNIDKTDIYNIHYSSDFPDNINANDLPTYLNIKGYRYKNLKNFEKIYHDLIKNKDFIGLTKLENYEFNLNKKNQNKVKPENIKKEMNNIKKKLNGLKKPINKIVFEQIVKRLNIIENEFSNKNYRYSQILLDTVKKLSKDLQN